MNFYLNMSLERSFQELMNEHFSFEIGHSKLKLLALKGSYQKQTIIGHYLQ